MATGAKSDGSAAVAPSSKVAEGNGEDGEKVGEDSCKESTSVEESRASEVLDGVRVTTITTVTTKRVVRVTRRRVRRRAPSPAAGRRGQLSRPLWWVLVFLATMLLFYPQRAYLYWAAFGFSGHECWHMVGIRSYVLALARARARATALCSLD